MMDYTRNKKATHEYFIEDTIIAGIKLIGCEVKSIIAHNCSISESYIDIDNNNEVWLNNCHIDEYANASKFDTNKYDPVRRKKLLLNKSEIKKLKKKVKEKGYTLIPLRLTNINNKVKVDIGIAKGKKQVDKRNDLKERQVKRDLQREMKYK